MPRRLAASLVLAMLAAFSGTGAVAAASPSAAPSVMPSAAPGRDRSPLALGISLIEGVTPTPDDDLVALDAFAARAGRMPASFSIWSDWGGANAAFPDAALLDGLAARGVRPVIFWQPVGPDLDEDPERYGSAAIARGDWDPYLLTWAEAAAASGDRVIVRFAHEMNAPWFPWAVGGVSGNTAAGFRAAWRHIVELIRPIAPEVRFLWSPNEPCGRPCVDLAELYPGDAWVDLAGFDAYDWKPAERRPMVERYREAMRALRAVTDKPVIVAETGAAGPADGRGEWLADGLAAVEAAFPRLEGLIWFDIDMRDSGHPDWRLTADDGSLAAWSAAALDPRFGGILDPAPGEEHIQPGPAPTLGPETSPGPSGSPAAP